MGCSRIRYVSIISRVADVQTNRSLACSTVMQGTITLFFRFSLPRLFLPGSSGEKRQLSRPPHPPFHPPATFQSSLTVPYPVPLLSLHRGNARIKTIEETNERVGRTYSSIPSIDQTTFQVIYTVISRTFSPHLYFFRSMAIRYPAYSLPPSPNSRILLIYGYVTGW